MPAIELPRVPNVEFFINEPAILPPTAPLTNWMIRGKRPLIALLLKFCGLSTFQPTELRSAHEPATARKSRSIGLRPYRHQGCLRGAPRCAMRPNLCPRRRCEIGEPMIRHRTSVYLLSAQQGASLGPQRTWRYVMAGAQGSFVWYEMMSTDV